MKKFFAPEVVQSSALDCGPASLKCLLEGFGTHVSYGRLREACQTGIDGTSIDTMETVANQLGLEAEQIMLPVDHLLLPSSQTLPSIVVVRLAGGLTHFVVAWRRHGRMLQLMDPAVGRRWTTSAQFAREVFVHTMPVAAADWRDYASSGDFQRGLTARMRDLRFPASEISRFCSEALNDSGWKTLATLDAGVRLLAAIARAGGANSARDCIRLLHRLCSNPDLIPPRFWSVHGAPREEDQLLMTGAVLVRVRGKRRDPIATGEQLLPELAAAIRERPANPTLALAHALRESGQLRAAVLLPAFAIAAGGVLIEAILFRGIFDINAELGLAGQRMAAIAAVLLFSGILLLLEIPLFAAALRLGRQIETRLRAAFLAKIPRLGDRYFQSRLVSDMAERSHVTHRLRHLPDLGRQFLRAAFSLCATTAGVIWLEPAAAPFVLLASAAALLPAFLTQPVLVERDLRVRSHAGALTRFYLDAMLGLLPIRAHAAARNVRREQEQLLGEWGHAALRLQRAVVSIEAVQLTAMFSLIAALLLLHPLGGSDIGRVLLLVYWALNIPVLGQEAGALARQYPNARNTALRLLEPLGAPEEPSCTGADDPAPPLSGAPSVEFRSVFVEAAGHQILQEIDLRIPRGAHVAIVGPSGAGKSSLVGVLLGWLKPSEGSVLIDSAPINCDRLRFQTAWVDPAVHLWNRSFLSNLSYGSHPGPAKIGRAVDSAMLRGVLENLPQGLQTKLGESGALVSGGEGQRIRLARAMLRRNVGLVVLDEPFRGLDREKRRQLLDRARELWRGSTMLCITHDIAETQDFDRVLVIEHGRVAEDGTPHELADLPDSRYSQLLEAEEQARSGLWSGRIWRRIRIHSGRIVEEIPEPARQDVHETEVA